MELAKMRAGAKLIKEGWRSFPPLYCVDRALNLWPRRGGSETPKSINLGLQLAGPSMGGKSPVNRQPRLIRG